MPLMNKNKERAILLISKRLKGEGNSQESMMPDLVRKPTNAMGDEVDADPGKSAAADEMIEAVKTGDQGMFSKALASFIDLHMSESGEETEE